MNLDSKKPDSKPTGKSKGLKQQSIGLTLSDKQKMYCAQAKWYIYSKQLVTPDAEVLTTYLLKKYIHAEFAVFVELLKICIDAKVKQSHGVAFAQLIHDGVMVANKSKYQSANLVICFGFEQCSDETASSIKKLIKDIGQNCYALIMQNIASSMVSDHAAVNVSKEFGLDLHDGCNMHDGDKVGQLATGTLTHSSGKVEVNPFPEGVELMKKASKASNMSLVQAR